jgi:hypothetical protein
MQESNFAVIAKPSRSTLPGCCLEAHKLPGAAPDERGNSADLAAPGESVLRVSSRDQKIVVGAETVMEVVASQAAAARLKPATCIM